MTRKSCGKKNSSRGKQGRDYRVFDGRQHLGEKKDRKLRLNATFSSSAKQSPEPESALQRECKVPAHRGKYGFCGDDASTFVCHMFLHVCDI
ncbi:hypothetical protein AMECASPLE_030354 [Ameca splendens]|uniref:Uncharacterized protein n=1 Tax=Ameca splendens TaxID=208324 RepID=A0ABV0YTN7_9TELE